MNTIDLFRENMQEDLQECRKVVIFELNLLLIGLLTYGMWLYSSNDQVLGSTLTDELFITSHRNRVLIFPVLSFIAKSSHSATLGTVS